MPFQEFLTTDECVWVRAPWGGAGHRRCAMWRMSNAQALIFVAAIVIAVAMLVLLA